MCPRIPLASVVLLVADGLQETNPNTDIVLKLQTPWEPVETEQMLVVRSSTNSARKDFLAAFEKQLKVLKETVVNQSLLDQVLAASGELRRSSKVWQNPVFL